MQKNSTSDYQGQPYQAVSLKIGKKGLDLRQTNDKESLTALTNAVFTDEESITRRTGFTAKNLQDQSEFPLGFSNNSDGTWLYGHGNIVESAIGNGQHYPLCNQSLATFNYDGADVSWTGDRLLIHNNSLPTCIGTSTYWAPGLTPTLAYGIPCFLPSLKDLTPPAKVVNTSSGNNTADTCVNDVYRCLVYTSNGNTFGQIIDLSTNQVVSLQQLNSAGTNNSEPRVVLSSGIFVVYWRDLTTNSLYKNSFNGTVWASESVEVVTANSYDVYSTGFNAISYLIYRTAAVIRARAYVGTTGQIAPFAFDTIIDTTGSVPSGPISIASSPTGNIGVAWYSTTGYWARQYSSQLTLMTGMPLIQVDSTVGTPDAVSITSKTLQIGNGNIPWVVYAGYLGAGTTAVAIVSLSSTVISNNKKFNCILMSRGFTCGNETFVWLRSGNFAVNFLISGVTQNIACGFADRGESPVPVPAGNRTLASVSSDPALSTKFTWARYITAPADQANHVRYSDIDFLPQITSAQYGKSVYISGSAVQNFDGFECSDAGFQDFPLVTGGVASAGGGLSIGNYSIRAYAVRYNNRGEKFMSPALTSATVVSGAAQKITWTIQTLQSCSAQDVIFEIYRTQANGTAYFLEGTVNNNLNAATVSFISTLSDATIAVNTGDSFQSQLGVPAESMNFGPVGCEILIAYNDRLWSAGGQIPDGILQFSKLKVTNFGAGFDAVAGTLTADSEGGEITSLAGMNDAIVAFEKNKIFVIDDNGPNNFRQGAFPAAKFAAAKGAISHFGTILTDVGVVYWNEGGPHVLTGQFVVQNISDKIRPLAVTMLPTGVILNPQQQEIIWFSSNGTALLWDYKSGNRWAQWTGLYVNGVSSTGLATVDGKLYISSSEVYTDGGHPYVFSVRTSELTAENLLSGYSLLRRYGIVGTYEGAHELEFRIYYNGSPLWEEDIVWTPETDTYLATVEFFGDLTPAQVDALSVLDKSGNYSVHVRAERQNCQRFQIEFLDNAPNGPSLIPQALEFELGARPGLGRVPVNTITDK